MSDRSAVEVMASELAICKGMLGIMAARISECEDGYYHDFTPADIERGLQKGVNVKFPVDGGAVLSVGMGS